MQFWSILLKPEQAGKSITVQTGTTLNTDKPEAHPDDSSWSESNTEDLNDAKDKDYYTNKPKEICAHLNNSQCTLLRVCVCV